MCLGVPGRVVEVDGPVATVDFWGIRKQVRLELLDRPVQRDDYILDYVGYAIRKIPSQDIEATLVLFEELLKQAEQDDDLMNDNVREEIETATKIR